MECDRIKPLLSEYLDRTLSSDLNRKVKEHLLSCKKCSNEFFLLKSVSAELAQLEKIKAPGYLLSRVNQAVLSPSWFRRMLDFIPGSGGFKVPMEFVTLATTVALVFLIFSSIQFNQKEKIITADSGRHNSITEGGSSSPVKLNFIPEAGRFTMSHENTVSVAEGNAPIDRDKLISSLTLIADQSGGNIIKNEYAQDGGYIDAVIVKIPSNNYGSFIRVANEIGRFNPPAPSLPERTVDPVLLRISLKLAD